MGQKHTFVRVDRPGIEARLIASKQRPGVASAKSQSQRFDLVIVRLVQLFPVFKRAHDVILVFQKRQTGHVIGMDKDLVESVKALRSEIDPKSIVHAAISHDRTVSPVRRFPDCQLAMMCRCHTSVSGLGLLEGLPRSRVQLTQLVHIGFCHASHRFNNSFLTMIFT
jgi:hypothetical protein